MPRMKSVTASAERYFEWTSVFSQGNLSYPHHWPLVNFCCLEEHESTDEKRTKHNMKLFRIDQDVAVAESSWWEVVGTGRRTVQFLWET